MSVWEIIGVGMLAAPVLWCFGQLVGMAFKTLARKDWLIVGGVVAWYAAAFVVLGLVS